MTAPTKPPRSRSTQPNSFRIADRVATRLKLKQLRLLVAIAEHSSILHAAESLAISQPTATKLLKDLELDFGVTLFHRTNRGVVATPHGEVLVRHGKLILTQIANAALELDDLTEGSGGRVVVGTLLAASAILLPDTIERLRAKRPNVAVVVREGTNDLLMPALRVGDVDLVVGRLPEYRHRDELVQEPLFDERIAVIARPGHPLVAKAAPNFADLAACEWILPPPETTLRRQIEKEFRDHDQTPPSRVIESVSYLTTSRLVRRSDMLCVWPYHVAKEAIEAGSLAEIPVSPCLKSSPVGVSYRRQGSLSPAAELFLDELRATATDMQNSENQTS